MRKFTTIYVIRHGQTEFNLKNIIGGTLEPNPLSDKGREQASELGKKFKNIKLDVLYSSDLSRTRETAKIIGSIKNLPVNIDSLLRERYWGVLQGKTFQEAQREYAEVFKKEATIEGQEAFEFRYVKDMESLGGTVSRFKQFLKKAVYEHKGKTLLIVCHFDIMIGYLVSLGFGSYQKLMNAKFDHTGYYKLISDGKVFNVEEIIGLNTSGNST